MHRNEAAVPRLPLTISPAVRWISLEGHGVWGSRYLILTLDVPFENIYVKIHKKVPFYKRIPVVIQP